MPEAMPHGDNMLNDNEDEPKSCVAVDPAAVVDSTIK